MELNEMEKKMLFQAEGDCQAKVLNELYMTVRYSNNSELREAAESLMAKVRVLSDRECMDLVRDIQKNYRLPHPPRTMVWWMRFKHWQAEKYGRRRLTKARRQSRHRESRKRNRLRCPGPDGVLPPLFRICSGAGSVRM